MVVGQLVKCDYAKTNEHEAYWVYGVVRDMFDGCYCIETPTKLLMYHLEKETADSSDTLQFFSKYIRVTALMKDGKPVVLKKKLFGRGYKLPKAYI